MRLIDITSPIKKIHNKKPRRKVMNHLKKRYITAMYFFKLRLPYKLCQK